MNPRLGAQAGLQAPDPSWCSYHQAPFRFFPEPALTPEQVTLSLIHRCERVAARSNLPLTVNRRYGSAVACCGDTWKLELHADDGEFWLTRADVDDDELDNVYGSPVDFIEKLKQERPWYLSKPAYETVLQLSSDLWIIGQDQFESALHDRWACIMARPTSPTSPFSVIPPDVLSAFTISLRNNYAGAEDLVSDATGLDGSRLYSIFVAPTLNSNALARKVTAGAQTKCLRWLTIEMNKSPNKAPKTHKEFKLEAMKLFEGLSGLGFDKAWKQALQDSGATWNAPGRRSKNPKSQTSKGDDLPEV